MIPLTVDELAARNEAMQATVESTRVTWAGADQIDTLAGTYTPEAVATLPESLLEDFDASIKAIMEAYGRLRGSLSAARGELDSDAARAAALGARVAAAMTDALADDHDEATDEALNAWQQGEQLIDAAGFSFTDDEERQAFVSLLGAMYLSGKVDATGAPPTRPAIVARSRQTRRAHHH